MNRVREEALRRAASRRALLVRLAQIAAASAVILCLVGAYAVVRHPWGTSGVTAGSAVTGAAPHPAGPAAAGRVETKQPVKTVSKDFAAWSVADAGRNVLFALGQGDCDAAPCPALIRSGDGGRRWNQVHAFSSADVSAALPAARPRVQPDGALSRVLFASPSTGYVFGGDLWVTHDAGATFTRVEHGDTNVLDVVLWQGQPLVLTATGCIQGQCTGRVELSRLQVGSASPSLAQPMASAAASAPLETAHVVVTERALVVVTGGQDDAGESPGWRLEAGSLVPITTGGACSNKSLHSAVPAQDGSFIALCDEAVSRDRTSFTTVRSADGGASWSLAGSGNLTLPTQGQVTLAALDDDHLVAASGGPRTAPDGTTRTTKDAAVAVSADAGASWKPATRLDSPPAGGFDGLMTTGARRVVAWTGLDCEMWSSGDQGQRWSHACVAPHGD